LTARAILIDDDMTPHQAEEYVQRMILAAVDDIVSFIDGQQENVVDFRPRWITRRGSASKMATIGVAPACHDVEKGYGMGRNMTELPDWPRMMKQVTAAAYCDMSVDTFVTLNPPKPVSMRKPDGLPRYDRKALDKWLDKLAGVKDAKAAASVSGWGDAYR